jgi:hypothetical protein
MIDPTTFKVIVGIIGIIVCIASYCYYGKVKNPIEQEVEQIVKEETGIDIDTFIGQEQTATTANNTTNNTIGSSTNNTTNNN